MGNRGWVGLLLAGVVLAGCSDEREPSPLEPQAPSAAPGGSVGAGSSCDLRDAKHAARSFFNPGSDLRKSAVDGIGEMEAHCSAEDEMSLGQTAWSVVGMVEDALEARSGAENDSYADLGNVLVGFMLACTESLARCGDPTVSDEDSNSIDFTGALGASGLFAVAGEGSEMVKSREPMAFHPWGDESVENFVRWALVPPPGPSWSSVVTGGQDHQVLFYGSAVAEQDVLSLDESSLGIPQYELNVFPDQSSESQISILACIRDGTHSHPPGDENEGHFVPRIQRETTILEGTDPAACEGIFEPSESSGIQRASLWGGLIQLLPRPLLALFSDEGSVRGVAGDLTNFSRFAPVGAAAAVELELVTYPRDDDGREVVGEGFTVEVLAKTGNGTPVEAVEITLYIAGNSGQGATFGNNSTEVIGITGEDDGIAEISTSLLQPGGYILCARGEFDPEFGVPSDVCTELFHVMND